jgi:hypothetical protein
MTGSDDGDITISHESKRHKDDERLAESRRPTLANCDDEGDATGMRMGTKM